MMRTAPLTLDYEREPDAIYRASFAQIEALPALADVPHALRPLAVRLVHTTGDPAVAPRLVASEGILAAGRAALDAGADIYCDTDTVRHGIMQRLLPAGCRTHCAVHDAATADHAKASCTTRSAAQFDLWGERLDGQIVAIGNAPTALFRLLEIVDAGIAKPACVLAFPVGFVGAAESKAELVRDPRGMAFATVPGRTGGSGWAQAAVNAVAGGLGR